MLRTRTFRLTAIALWALSFGLPAQAQELPEPEAGDEGGAYQALKSGEGNEPEAIDPAGESKPLTPQEQAGLIDKHRLAVEAADQLMGLREAGNPHIPEGLELRNIQDDPRETQVDQEKLREEAIRRIEDREGFLRPLPDVVLPEGKAVSPSSIENAVPAKTVEEPKPPRANYPWNHLVLIAAGVLSLISIWVAFRR